MIRGVIFSFVFFLVILLSGKFISADEGMWLLNNAPKDYLKKNYGFDADERWLKHVQKSSARLPNCSSSFVSSSGLIMTNGHCAEEAVQSLSTPKNNLYEKGFYARTFKEELKTALSIRVLMGVTDVTQTVNEAVANNTDGNSAKARQEVISRIQKNKIGLSAADILNVKSSLDNNDSFVCEVVILYQGGQYQNYCYRVYNDIRLVFAAEKNIWFFGGDADNFEYPRYTMDVAFLRAYENSKPAKTPEHFKWSKSGAKPNELIFVSGHPGSTKRLLTSKALKTERDIRVPFLLDLFRRREMTLQQFMIRGKEQSRVAESDLFSWQNSRKLYAGKLRGLQDPKLMANKIDSERKFFKDFYNDPVIAGKYANGLIAIDDAQDVIKQNYSKYILLARGLGFDSGLYGYAQSLVSGNQAAPLNLEYEEAKLRDSLVHLVEVFGPDDPMITEMLKTYGGPSYMAQTLVYYTAVSDINEHKKLLEMDSEIFEKLSDPMINLTRFIKPHADKYLELFNNAAEQERRGYALLSEALFQGYGASGYPDATFTLRLSFGKMSGYEENKKSVPFQTVVGSIYKHSSEFDNAGNYKLPARWRARKKFVRLRTPLNFISDLDITGGNSGSPVFNKNLEIIGIVFDGNIHGLVSDYDYNYSPQARAVAVHSAGITEILSKIYRADRLVRELTQN